MHPRQCLPDRMPISTPHVFAGEHNPLPECRISVAVRRRFFSPGYVRNRTERFATNRDSFHKAQVANPRRRTQPSASAMHTLTAVPSGIRCAKGTGTYEQVWKIVQATDVAGNNTGGRFRGRLR